MRIRIIVAGKPSLAFARDGCAEYLKRLRRFGSTELISVKAGTPAATSALLLERSEGCLRIGLDERGSLCGSREFASMLGRLEAEDRTKTLAFLIGAADGHDDLLRRSCDRLLALSSFTLQHELALLVLLEQLYRAACIRAGSPYHRD
jgi:23S rRNA (pseudouridine1915-N3)-methyltransferase